MAKKSSSQESSKSKKTTTSSSSSGNADIRSFFMSSAPPVKKDLKFGSDDEKDEKSEQQQQQQQKKNLTSTKDSKENKESNTKNNKIKVSDSTNKKENDNNKSSTKRLTRLKKKEENSSDEMDTNQDDDFDLPSDDDKEKSINKNNNKSNSKEDNVKIKSVTASEDKKQQKKQETSTRNKKSQPISKDIDLTSEEEVEEEVNDKSNKNKSLKRKEKPQSSDEDEKQEEKKRKVKTPEKSISKSSSTPTKSSSTPTKSSSTPTKSSSTPNKSSSTPNKSKTPDRPKNQLEFEPLKPLVSNSPNKLKTPERKVVNCDGMEVEQVYLDLKPNNDSDEIFGTRKSSTTPQKSSSSSTPQTTPKGKQEKLFNDDDIFNSPNKIQPPRTRSQSMSDDEQHQPKLINTTPQPTIKRETTSSKFNEDDIFDSPAKTPPSKSNTNTTSTKTPIVSATKKEKSNTPTKKEKFNEDDIFNSTPETSKNNNAKLPLQTKSKLNGSGKFNDDDIFDNSETDEEEEPVKKRSISSKLQKIKEKEYDDEDTEDETTEEEEEEEKQKNKKKQPVTKKTSTPSNTSNTSNTPTPNGYKSAKQENFLKFKFQERQPPPNKGLKPLPYGKVNCLKNKVFLISGVLDSLERNECEDLIKQYGGHVAKSAVKKLTHMIVGIEPSTIKLEKAKKIRGVKFWNEDELFEEINKTNPNPPSKPKPQQKDEEQESIVSTPSSTTTTTTTASTLPSSSTSPPTIPGKSIVKPSLPSLLRPTLPTKQGASVLSFKPSSTSPPSSQQSMDIDQKPQQPQQQPVQNISMSNIIVPSNISKIPKGHDQLWVEKYKPNDLKDLIGNNTLFDQLSKFLDQWNTDKPPSASKDKDKRMAVLLSGPPGIGKTSAAILLCKLKGFEPIELNASDTRSKSEIERVLKGVGESQNISHFFSASPKTEKPKKNAIILDEIDGSSGNADRGGISEIIKLIKDSKVPFICICNDYYSQKIKSLKNYCIDLRLRRPMANQITQRLLQIAKHEGMKVSDYMVQKIYESTHSDIRQTINSLQMLARSKKQYDNFNIQQAIESKDFDITPFSAAELIFKTQNADINTHMEYFFSDFSLVPLLIQENYLSITPYSIKNKEDLSESIELFSNAADAISDSDQIGRAVGKEMAWNLLPSYGVSSTILPAGYIRGYPNVMPLRFPSYLGKYSNASKQQRFVKDLQLHMRSTSKTFSNRDETRLYYVPMLKHYLVEPLVKDGSKGIDPIIDLMDQYGLTEDDRNNIIELSTWGKEQSILDEIPSTVKSSFTRKFRSTSHAIYDHSLLSTSTKGSVNIAEGYEEVEGEESNQLVNEDEENENDDSEDISKSNLIKIKTNSKSDNKNKSSTTSSKSKAKSKK